MVSCVETHALYADRVQSADAVCTAMMHPGIAIWSCLDVMSDVSVVPQGGQLVKGSGWRMEDLSKDDIATTAAEASGATPSR